MLHFDRLFHVVIFLMTALVTQDGRADQAKYLVESKVVLSRGTVAISEVSRRGNISRLRLTGPKGTGVGEAILPLFDVINKIAAIRKTSHFVILKDTDSSERSAEYVVGFTNSASPEISSEFGRDFPAKMSDGSPRHVFSVKEVNEMLSVFGATK